MIGGYRGELISTCVQVGSLLLALCLGALEHQCARNEPRRTDSKVDQH